VETPKKGLAPPMQKKQTHQVVISTYKKKLFIPLKLISGGNPAGSLYHMQLLIRNHSILLSKI
jgi:hypothetical protein